MFRLSLICLICAICVALCGCERNNQLMIRPADGIVTYCSPLEHVVGQDPTNTRCIEGLETLGFTKAENVALAGGGGIYLAEDGRVLSSEELAALSPNIPPQNRSYPPKASGLKPGDAIIAVNGVTTKSRSEIVPHLIGKPNQQVTVRIRRNNIEQDVTMGFKPYLESEGNVSYNERYFFHYESADNLVSGRR